MLNTLMKALPSAVRAALEKTMAQQRHEFQSEFFNRHFGAALKRGLALGREEGREEGRETGREEGVLVARKDALLAVLAARGIRLDAATRARVAKQRDLARLDAWIARAAVADSVGQVFRSPRRPAADRQRPCVRGK